METFFTSDHHFGHQNIIKYCRPEFRDVYHMDEELVERWNAKVGPNDRVYHGGDFAWSLGHAKWARKRLNGTIYLIVGNHDDIPDLVNAKLFKRVSAWRKFRDWGFIMSHFPLPKSQLFPHFRWNVHGHVHNNNQQLEEFHINICVEETDYAPLHLDELLELRV